MLRCAARCGRLTRPGQLEHDSHLLRSTSPHRLRTQLRSFASYVALTAAEKRAREHAVSRVHELASQLRPPPAGVQSYGSWAAGLSAYDGDVDLRIRTE